MRLRRGWDCVTLSAPWVAGLLGLISTGEAVTCGPSPFAVPIGNVSLSNNAVARGMKMSVGTPPQSLAFLPQWPMNNSFVYGTNGYCVMGGTTTSAACTTFRGGAYNPFASTTRQVAPDNSHPQDSAGPTQISFVTDTLALNDAVTLENFALGMPLADWGSQGYHPMMAIGLGFNSTLLNTLKSAGKIASRSWSMFWGLNGATSASQMEGTFVFGGYDKAKVKGRGFTLPLEPGAANCASGMIVTITDMVLNFPDGKDVSLFSGSNSEAISACVVPDYPVLMTLALDPYFNNFQSATNSNLINRSFGLVFYANRYNDTETPYAGDLTFTLQSGLSIRITNDQLVVPDRYIDANSGVIMSNATGPDLVINAIQSINADDMSQLGRQFLSGAYLMVNQDAGQFTLWEANPTLAQDLVAVDETNAVATGACDQGTTNSSSIPSSTSSSTANPNPSSSTSSNDLPGSGPSSRLSTGQIAGISVGAATIGAIIGGLLLMWLRKWNKKAAGKFRNETDRDVPVVQYRDTQEYRPESYAKVPVEYAQAELPGRERPLEAGHQEPFVYELGQ